MSSELPHPMPTIEWHFMDEHPLCYGATGYILFHALTGSEQELLAMLDARRDRPVAVRHAGLNTWSGQRLAG